MKRIDIYGTIHTSEKSRKEINYLIESDHYDNIFLELDNYRAKRIKESQLKTLLKAPIRYVLNPNKLTSNITRLLLLPIYIPITIIAAFIILIPIEKDKAGLVIAYEKSTKKKNTKTHLIDTKDKQNSWNLRKKLKIFYTIIKHDKLSKTKNKSNNKKQTSELINKIKQNPNKFNNIKEMSQKEIDIEIDKLLFEPNEREKTMLNNILENTNPSDNQKSLIIVGDKHVKPLSTHLKDKGFKVKKLRDKSRDLSHIPTL